MNSVGLSLLSLICYAFSSSLISRFLGKEHPLVAQGLTNCLNPIFFIVGYLVLLAFYSKPPSVQLTPQLIVVSVICNLLLFVGGMSFCAAMHTGGSITLITAILSMLPVMATFINMSLDVYFSPEEIRRLTPQEIIGTIGMVVSVIVFIWK